MNSNLTSTHAPSTTPPSDRSARAAAILDNRWFDVFTLLVWSAAGVAGAQLLGPTSAAGNAVALAGVLGALALVAVLLRWRGERWSTLGFSRPASWLGLAGKALVATLVALLLHSLIQQLVIAPLLADTAADHGRFAALRGKLPTLLATLVSVWLSAAFAEEVIYRGFLMGRLARLLGGGRAAWLGSLLLSSAFFGALHLYQGLAGVLATGLSGLLLGAIYLVSGRNLWLVILVHGLMNTISLTMIYLGLGQ